VDELGADANDGQTEVIQRIQQILNTLPRGIKPPFMVRYDLSNIPVALITVSGGHLDERQLYDLPTTSSSPRSSGWAASRRRRSTAAKCARSP
jgi:multidrug efflux pump subunit AcrB